MNNIESLNEWSARAGSWAVTHLTGTAIVLVAVALVWLMLRKRSAAALGCWLFLLVLVKPIIPFEIGVPQSWMPFQAAAKADSAAPVAATPEANPASLEFEASSTTTVAVVVADGPPAVMEAPAFGNSEPKTAVATQLSWQSSLAIAWIAIVAILLSRFVWLQLATARWMRRSSPLTEVETELATLAKEIGLRSRVRVFSNPKLDTPLVCGLLRPSLILPQGFEDRLNADQRRWVFLHELAHLKRGDLWVLAFQRLVQIAFFFNPSIWIANRAINRLREYACDDVALVHSKIDRRSCGEGFLRVVEHAHTQPMPGAAALALFERHSDSKRRLARILDSRRKLAVSFGVGSTALLLVMGLALLPGLRAQEVGGDDPDAPEKANPEGVADVADVAAGAPDLAARGRTVTDFESLDSFTLVNPPPGSPPGQGKIPVHTDGKTPMPTKLKLLIEGDGSVYDVGDLRNPIPRKKLEAGLRRAKELRPEIYLHFEVGEDLKTKHFVDLMDAVAAAGIRNVSVSGNIPQSVRTEIREESAGTDVGAVDVPERIGLVVKSDGRFYEAGDNERAIPEKKLAQDLERARKLNPQVKVRISTEGNPGADSVRRLEHIVRSAGIANMTTLHREPADDGHDDAPRGSPPAGEVTASDVDAVGRVIEKARATPTPKPGTYTRYRLAIPRAGIVKYINAKPGAWVKRGDKLLQLDARQAEAALKVAEIRAVSLQKEMEQKLDLVNEQIASLKRQVEGNLIPKSELDKAMLEAGRLGGETDLAVAEAQLEQARTALAEYQVLAPASGRIEVVVPNLGEYVSPESPVIILQVPVKTAPATVEEKIAPGR